MHAAGRLGGPADDCSGACNAMMSFEQCRSCMHGFVVDWASPPVSHPRRVRLLIVAEHLSSIDCAWMDGWLV
jgi:hypothetical protein